MQQEALFQLFITQSSVSWGLQVDLHTLYLLHCGQELPSVMLLESEWLIMMLSPATPLQEQLWGREPWSASLKDSDYYE